MTPRPVDAKAVGARIALARERAGIKQAELAEQLGVIPRSVQNYEYGRIPYRYLDKLAEILDVPKDWILYGDDTEIEAAAVDVVARMEARFDELSGKLDAIIDALKKRPR
jgi:transcriptional regulator with XRE-family HTH domain